MLNTSSILRDLTAAQQQITLYVNCIYLVFGLIGCSFSIILFSRRRFRTSSCATYFLAMSIVILIHISIFLISGLYAIKNGDPTIQSSAWCKLRHYSLQATSMMYRWCLTAACFDRFALSSTSLRLRSFAKVDIAWRVITFIVTAWLILPVHTIILYDVRGIICGIVYSSAGALYHSIFTTTMAAVLPSTVMIICAILLHRNLRLKQKQRRQRNPSRRNSSRSQKEKSDAKRDQQILIMLIFQVLIYLILMTPLMSMYFYNAITLSISDKSLDRIAIERFVWFIAEMIILIYPVSSFYMHTMISRMFRNELVKILRLILINRPNRNSVHVGSAPNIMLNHQRTIPNLSKLSIKQARNNPAYELSQK